MASTTDNFNLDLYDTGDPANLNDQYNASMHTIDATMLTISGTASNALNKATEAKNTADTLMGNVSKNRRIAAQRNMQQRFVGQYVGHQGNYLSAPGNTKPSYDAAISAGYKILECDVRSTSDGVLVLCHDDDLSVWTDAVGKISNTSYADLMTIDITKGSHAKRYSGLHFYKLTDYLQQCNSNGCIAFLDDKIFFNPLEIADTCVNTVGFTSWCYMGGIKNCNTVLSKYPDAAACAVMANPTEDDWVKAEAYQLIGIHVMAANITQDMVNTAHKKGLLIGGWNTNEQGTIKHLLDLGVDFINVDGTWYTVQLNDNDDGPYRGNHARYLSPIAAAFSSKHIANIGTTGGLTSSNIDYKSHTIHASNIPSTSTLVDVRFGGDIQAVQINQKNDYYNYILTSFVQNGNLSNSGWIEDGGIYYLVARYDDATALNDSCFAIGFGNRDGRKPGDVDFFNVRDNVRFVEDSVAKNLQLTRDNKKQYAHLYMTPIPARQNDTFNYFASSSDGTNGTERYAIYELDENGTQVHDSGYLTDDGTYTCVSANTRFIQCVFLPHASFPMSRKQIINFMPIMQTLLGL